MMMTTSHWTLTSYSALVCPGGHRLSQAPPDPSRPRHGATPAPHSSSRCHRQKNGRRNRNRRAGGVARRPSRYGLLGPRERRGSPGRVSIVFRGFSLPVAFLSPFLGFHLKGRRFFRGCNTIIAPGDLICIHVFWLGSKALDSERRSPWFEPHVSSFFFAFFKN